MGALTPVFLAAAVAVGIPIFLHLFQRHETRRVSFPALRYLERTEREHARRIRFRQLLLLLLRVGVLLLLVGAGARLFFGGRGTAHPPTAVVIVIDNSLSSGLVVGERRVLDGLKALADEALVDAGDEDRFWILPAGEPWRPALPGTAAEARAALSEIEASDAAADLAAAVRRAIELLQTSDLEHREVHLLTDLQRSAFSGRWPPSDDSPPIVVFTGAPEAPPNHALTEVLVGGGLPPLEGQRTEVSVTARSSGGDTVPVPVRLVLDERIRGAGSVPPGSAIPISLPASGTGWVRGYADSDPDALRADDRRFFAYRSRPPATLSVQGDPGLFLGQAVSVLDEARRISLAGPAGADVVLAAGGSGLDAVRAGGAAIVVPPADPTLLPALNRRLTAAGIPWRYTTRSPDGEADLEGRRLPESLSGVRVRRWYDLALTGDPATAPNVLAEVAGDAWAVEGADQEERRYLLLASALDMASTTLPVSSGMLPFVDWAVSAWAGAGGGPIAYEAGDAIPAPRAAALVRFPSGVDVEIDGTRTVRGTGQAGFYTFLDADTVVAVVAVNPPVAESDLSRLDTSELRSLLGDDVVTADREGAWARAVFRARQGPELWWPLLLAAVVLLLIEAVVAAAGRVETRGTRSAPATASGAAGDVAA